MTWEGWETCETCGTPYETGNACDNPACVSNPTLSDERRAALREAQERRAAERAEREMLARARRRAFEKS